MVSGDDSRGSGGGGEADRKATDQGRGFCWPLVLLSQVSTTDSSPILIFIG